MKKKLKNLSKIKLLKSNPLKEQLIILENISIFLNRGYSLSETLILLQYRYNLEGYIEMLKEGELFSEILQSYNFDKDILLVMEIAEKSGDLRLGVENSYLIIKQKLKNKNDIFELLKYPLLLLGIICVALSFISFFLIPQFQQIYSSFNMEQDGVINTLFNLIRLIPGLILILFIILFLFFIVFSKKSQDQKLKFYLNNKKIAKHYISLYNQIFTINIVNLMKIGLRLDEIFIILSQQEYNKLLKLESIRILNELEEGKQLYETLQCKYYTKELIVLVKEGETFSTLLHNLENYMLFLEQKQDKKTKKMFFLIQPIFYGIFGVLIVMLYATIFMPMFTMMQTI